MSNYPFLELVNNPRDLRKLKKSHLPTLAAELREFLIQSVSETGGHLAPNLGTIELTLALHYIFNTPEDRLVWDVGHQSYTHKIITGRRKLMPTLRQLNGLAGFPKRDESEYDTFDVGHASTSISAALGMAIAARKLGLERKSIAVIGDGAMTAGMAFEALNHAGDEKADLLVVLNDNKMSISENVGGLSKYLAKIIGGKFYMSVRKSGKKVLKKMPSIHRFARRWEEHMKGMALPGTLFEELGFNYIGPIDGHDLPTLLKIMENIKDLKGPQFLHVVTQKGKGYAPAENDPRGYHGVPRFDPETGEQLLSGPGKSLTWTDIFSQWLTKEGDINEKLMAITPAMGAGSGLTEYAEKYPDRYFDVGIAEQHSVTLAAGMACEGFHPVVAIYSTFLQRAYDQLIHDVALQKLPILFAVDRAGLVGPDGPTHAGNYDISFLRCLPNLVIMAPADAGDCEQMLTLGMQIDGPTVVRYPRDQAPTSISDKNSEKTDVVLGKGRILRQGLNVAILAFGSMVEPAVKAAKQLNATLVDMRFVKPLDEQLITAVAQEHTLVVTIEENSIAGGAGSAVSEYLDQQGIIVNRLHLGIPDRIIEQGARGKLLEMIGLDSSGMIDSIKNHMQKHCIQECTQVIS